MTMHHLLRYMMFATLLALFSHAAADTLTVAVAANVQYPFNDLKAAFRNETGHDIEAIINSSGKLAAQIMNGAPFHVFLSADMEYPEKLHAAGLAASAPAIYAYGALVLWTTKGIDLANWQRALRAPSVRKIALANPKTTPYGRESMKVLAHYKLDEVLKSKLVFGESISQTNQYIHSQAADAGFTAKAVVLSPQLHNQGRWIELPRNSYDAIAQGAVILKHGESAKPALARQFHDFLHSIAARDIFSRYGYQLP